MPKRPSAKNLKEWALNCVAQNIEEICYGFNRGSKELAKFYHEEQYLEVEGPFVVRFLYNFFFFFTKFFVKLISLYYYRIGQVVC